MLVTGDTSANGDVGPFRRTQISFPGGNPGPRLLPYCCKAMLLRVLPALEG